MSGKLRSIMTSFVAFVGVGKAGCKIAQEFMKKGYSAYFINSSEKDLSIIDAPKSMKYQIPFAQGTNGNRKLAKQYCREYFDIIVRNIRSKLGNFTHIYFCFSAGGGTGSGITPTLINNLIKKTEDIDYGIVCALPATNDHPQSKYNAYECIKEIQKIEDLCNVFFIDNNFTMFKNKNLDLDTVNELFAMRFNNAMLTVDTDDTGNIDETEMRAALSIKGCCTFADITDDKDKPKIKTDSMMLKLKKGCQFILYSLTNKDNKIQDIVEEEFGKPNIAKTGKGADDFISVFGLPYPTYYINDMAKYYTDDVKVMESIEDDDIEIVDIEYVNPMEQRRKNIKLAEDVDKLLEEFDEL